MNRTLPIGLLRQHGDMLRGMAAIAWQSLRRHPSGFKHQGDLAPISRVIPAPDEKLVDLYADWCGACRRYPETLPPHMASQWGLPLITELMLKTGLPMTKVINQGVTMTMWHRLPRREPLHLQASIQRLEEQDGLVRVSVMLSTGTATIPSCVDMTLHMAFLMPGHHRRKTVREQPQEPLWSAAGWWLASEHDGLRFALLTGDFNPIHWIGLAGKYSAFGRKVLHGFGMLARSFEYLGPVRELDVRFLKPVPLPSHILRVETAPPGADSRRPMRLRDEDGTVHLAGTFC